MPDFTATVADAFQRAAAKDGSHSVTITLAFPEEMAKEAFDKYNEKIQNLAARYLKENGKTLNVKWEQFKFQ
jgi:hypothetical protein